MAHSLLKMRPTYDIQGYQREYHTHLGRYRNQVRKYKNIEYRGGESTLSAKKASLAKQTEGLGAQDSAVLLEKVRKSELGPNPPEYCDDITLPKIN